MTHTITTPTVFIGWHRPSPRSRWRAVVTAASEADALGLLLDAVAGGDKIVLAEGIDANDGKGTR